MDEVVSVCFRPSGKIYYFCAAGLKLRPGDRVIAETSRGQELAEVVGVTPQTERCRGKLKPILRRATESDIVRAEENRRREEEARRVCQRALRQMQAVVKLVDVEYAFDGSRITFSFASDDKMDFRELQRRLRNIYDCEIEVRQIGVRDQAKILGGLGPCGRPLCCASFLRTFHPVTIRMAKDQELALNPAKISGQCGRLMCCLRYEHELYQEANQDTAAEKLEAQMSDGSDEMGPCAQEAATETASAPVSETTIAVPVSSEPHVTAEVGSGADTVASTEQSVAAKREHRRRRRSHRRPPAAPTFPPTAAEPPSHTRRPQSAGLPVGDERQSRPRGRRRRRGPSV